MYIRGNRCEKYETEERGQAKKNKDLLRQRTVAGYLNLRFRTGEEA